MYAGPRARYWHPMPKDQVVRTPVATRERSRRTLDQRFSLRFPRLATAYIGLIGKLRPESRLRRSFLPRGVQLGAEAYNRRDLEATVIGFHPDFEYRPAHNWVEAGFFEPCYRGLDGYREYVDSTAEVFGGEVYFKPVEVVDFGHRIVVLADAPMRAQAAVSR